MPSQIRWCVTATTHVPLLLLQEHKMWTTMSLLLQHCSSGGLDLYPAGCLHQFLQQQLTQPHQQQQPPLKQPQQQQLQGPLDPGSLTPAYLANLESLDVGSASYWVRPVPAMLNTQLPRMPTVAGNGAAVVPGRADGLQVGSTALSSSSKPGAAAGLQSVRAAYMQAAGARGRGAASIDLTPSDLADARRAAAAAAADSRAGGRFPPTSSGSSAARRPLRQQQHEQHRAPRRSLSWPLGVLYSAFSWAQTAQLRHRQRSFWQRAWGLHPLIEGSERGSESSAASSIDASSYRSSSSTQRSSTVTSLDDMAPWARRVSSGLGRLAGGPAAAVAAAAAAAATGGRSIRGSQQRDAPARRVSERSSTASERNNAPARASWTAGVDGKPDAAARSSTAAAAAVMAAAGATTRSCDMASVQGADAAGARDSTSAAQRIAALQTSLLAQAALPPEKVESLKAAAQARAQQQRTGVKAQQPLADVQPLAAPAGAGASGVAACAVDGAAGSSRDAAEQLQEAGSSKPTAPPATELDAAEAAVSQQQQQRDASAGPKTMAVGVAAEQEQGLATPDVAAAGVGAATAAAAVDVGDDARTVAAGAGPGAAEAAVTAAVLGAEAVSTGSAVLGLTRQQRKAAASAAAAQAADHRASVVAAALTVVGVVELCASQLLTVFMVLYCLCFLPSIIPGLQPPHLVEAMSRRPAWMEGLLLLLLGLHWFAVTNVSIVRPSSQRPRTSTEAHRAAVQTASSAAAAVAAAAEDAAAVQAGRRRRQEEHRLQRLRERQQRLLGRAMLSSVAAAVALGLLCYSLCVFAAAWRDHMLGDGAGVLFLYRKWNEWQQRVCVERTGCA